MASKVDTASPDYGIGERIFKARDKAGLSQMELADAAGLERKTICRIESGKGTYFSNVISIAVALGKTPNDFCPEGTLPEQSENQELIKMFESLNGANRDIVKNLMASLLATQG